MSLAQTMITLGTFILLIMTVISANQMINDNSKSQLKMQAIGSSAAIANDLLLEITSKPFDRKVVSDTTTTPWTQDATGAMVTNATSSTNGLTTPSDSLGQWGCRARHLITLPDSSYNGQYKSITKLKDVDDYDGYQRTVTYNGISGFVLDVSVYYVSATIPDTKSTTRTFYKKIEITVSHPQYMTVEHNTTGPDVSNTAVYSALVSY
jgi:hypothetical protein